MASKLDTLCICGHAVCEHFTPAEYSEYDPQIYRGLSSVARLGGCSECANCDDPCFDDEPMVRAACQNCGGTGIGCIDEEPCLKCDAVAVVA